jgi:hypothetical protein
MARATARQKISRGVRCSKKIVMLKKNAENLGFIRSFSFTLRERSRIIRMSVRTENTSRSFVHGKNRTSLDKYKGEIWQS